MRERGRTRHPSGARGMDFLIGKIFQRYGDPDGQLRHRGKNQTTDQLHYSPNMPNIPTYGHVNVWDFNDAYDVNTTNVWDETNSGSGTPLVTQDKHGGFAKVTNGASDNNYYFYESKYEIARLQSGKDLWFRSRFFVGDADQADLFIGLCARLASGTLFDNRVDSIGFYLTDGDATLKMETQKNGSATQTATTLDVSDDTEVVVDLHVYNTTQALFFVSVGGYEAGSYTGKHTATIPDDTEMAFSFGCRNGRDSANNMLVGRTILIQDE